MGCPSGVVATFGPMFISTPSRTCVPAAPRWARPLRAAVAVHRARRMLVAGAAVLLDTETTDLDGAMREVAVIDTDGTVLLNTLVRSGVPIAAAAAAVHGITDRDLADAPTTGTVLAELVQVVGDRQVLAYNAPFDYAVLLRDAHRTGVPVGGLAAANRWGCVMRARAAADGRPWQALEGGHRALGDTQATLQVVQDLASRPLLPTRRHQR